MTTTTEHVVPEFQREAFRLAAIGNLGEPAWMQCLACERWWDDSLITDRTPTPAGRCPFEGDHVYEPEPDPYVCADCGSADIQIGAWISVNDRVDGRAQVISQGEDGPSGSNVRFCPSCDANPAEFVPRSEYLRNNPPPVECDVTDHSIEHAIPHGGLTAEDLREHTDKAIRHLRIVRAADENPDDGALRPMIDGAIAFLETIDYGTLAG